MKTITNYYVEKSRESECRISRKMCVPGRGLSERNEKKEDGKFYVSGMYVISLSSRRSKWIGQSWWRGGETKRKSRKKGPRPS